MRKWLPIAVLLGIVLFVIASSRTSAQPQSPQAAITSGEKLNIWFDPNGAGHPCTVIEVRGDFVGCRIESQGTGAASERWYNLRLVVRIDRPAKR